MLGLGLTVWYARRAWQEAQKAAVSANKTLEHSERVAAMQLRPWLSISLKPLRVTRASYGNAFKFDLEFENFGSTVARAFYVEYEMMFEGEHTLELVQKWRERTRKEWVQFRGKVDSAVMPGERIAYTLVCSYSDEILPWTADGLTRVSVVPLVTVLAFYRSEEGSWHETARSFNFGQAEPGLLHECVFKDGPDLFADDMVVVNRGGSFAT